MNDFENLMKKLDELSNNDRSQKLKELERDCVCPICPSYNECAKEKEENIFCIIGKSKDCINTELGCMCPTCPLAQKYQIGVIHNFYCHRGSESEQS